MSPSELAPFIDHTMIHPWATRDEIIRLCAEAKTHKFHGVCVNSSRVELAYSQLEDTEVKICALIDFPLGGSDSDVKRYATEVAIDQGASEIEFVINIGKLKDGEHQLILREMRDIAEAADERTVKIVLETGLLTLEEVTTACAFALDSGAHFVCTGSGVGAPADATVVRKLKDIVGPKFGVKASGVLKDFSSAQVLIDAGATLVGATNAPLVWEEKQSPPIG